MSMTPGRREEALFFGFAARGFFLDCFSLASASTAACHTSSGMASIRSMPDESRIAAEMALPVRSRDLRRFSALMRSISSQSMSLSGMGGLQIAFDRGRMADQAAEVEEVFLRGGALFELYSAPLVDEFLGGELGWHGIWSVLWVRGSGRRPSTVDYESFGRQSKCTTQDLSRQNAFGLRS